MKSLIALLLAVLFSLTAVAQEKKASGKAPAKGARKSASAPPMPMVKPAPEMEKITKSFAGTWRAEEKHEASDMMPAGTSTGIDMVKVGPGGLSLVSDYRAKGDMGAFVGHGIIWWDGKDKVYKALWCDSMSPAGCENGGTGQWQGDNLVFNAEGEMMGKRYQMRNVYADIKPDSYTFSIDMSEGRPMKRVMTIHYTRAAKSKAMAAQ